MALLDWLILYAFLLYVVVSALRNRKVASQDLGQYFLAGRTLDGTTAGLSMAATQFAADTPLLVTGLIASAGIFSLWRLWVYGLAFLLLGFVLAPAWRRANVLTDAELCEVRYGGRAALWLRTVKALYFGIVFNCGVLAMVLFAATRIAEPFLTWHAWLPNELHALVQQGLRAVELPLSAAPAPTTWLHSADNAVSLLGILLVTLLYSSAGGLRSVVQTDRLQLLLALAGTALYAYYLVAAAGGLGALHAQLDQALALHPTAMGPSSLLAFTPEHAHQVSSALLGVMGLQWLLQMNADGTGYLAQRCLACRSDQAATQATLVFAWTQIVLRSLLWLPIGLALLVLYPITNDIHFTAAREATYVQGMADYLPVGAKGLLFTAMLAALASTLDTHLNWGASYLTNDLYDSLYCQVVRGRPAAPRTRVRIARLSNLVIMLIAILVMTQLSSIQMAWQISLLLGAGMGTILLMRWLWWRVTAWAELAGLLTSTALAPLLLHWLPNQEALRLLCMGLGTTATAVLVSLIKPPTQDRIPQLVAFYERVQPPGYWKPIALAAGLDPAAGPTRLAHSLLRTAAATCSLFCTLLALGTWLVGGTVPAWFALPALWSPGLLAAALAVAPLWWPGLIRNPKPDQSATKEDAAAP